MLVDFVQTVVDVVTRGTKRQMDAVVKMVKALVQLMVPGRILSAGLGHAAQGKSSDGEEWKETFHSD